jgi:hypothetical protein
MAANFPFPFYWKAIERLVAAEKGKRTILRCPRSMRQHLGEEQ